MSDTTRDKKRAIEGDTTRQNGVSRVAPNVAPGVTITAAALRLGVSVRTVQRRLDAGILRSIERDGRRLVLLDGDATEGDITRQNGVSRDTTQRDIVTRHATPNDATRDATGVTLLIEQRDRDRAEIAFLRGLVEQRDRDAAELRAALRKALDSMPRALTEGTASAPESPRAPKPAPDVVLPVARSDGPEIAQERDEWPDLEAGEMEDLIYRVFGNEKA